MSKDIKIEDVFKLVAGHSVYSGDSILSAFTCLSEGKDVKPIKPVYPERPQGEWKLHGMIYYCSKCGHECGESGDNFCGNCGADMRGGSQ